MENLKMNICLSNDEKYFLQKFADEQHDGAKANVGTVTPIHLVMRKRKHFCESSYGDIFAFLNCAEYIAEERHIADDVRKVVIRPDNRRWDFADEECSRTSKTIEEKNQRNIKIGIGVR